MNETPVPFLDLGPQTSAVADEFLAGARRLVDANRFIGGDEVERFEQDLALYLASR